MWWGHVHGRDYFWKKCQGSQACDFIWISFSIIYHFNFNHTLCIDFVSLLKGQIVREFQNMKKKKEILLKSMVLQKECIAMFPTLAWIVKTGFHQRLSRSQKCRAIRSSENQSDGVTSRTPIPLITPSLTSWWKLRCRSRKQKRKNKPITMFDS